MAVYFSIVDYLLSFMTLYYLCQNVFTLPRLLKIARKSNEGSSATVPGISPLKQIIGLPRTGSAFEYQRYALYRKTFILMFSWGTIFIVSLILTLVSVFAFKDAEEDVNFKASMITGDFVFCCVIFEVSICRIPHGQVCLFIVLYKVVERMGCIGASTKITSRC
jgi:hypothetical protein